MLASLSDGQITYLYARLLYPILVAALVTTLVETVRQIWNRLMEKRLTAQHQEMVLANYENLRHHQEEVMIILHDMLHHFRTLQEMNSEHSIAEYLADLIGQNEKIHSVVRSGNEMLDIILNGKLGTAIDRGVHVEIISAAAPEKLSLRDADLCSLVINIVDNAVAGALKTEDPFLRLNIHVKGNFLAFVCENSAAKETLKVTETKETVPKHGLGLKIIHSIVKQYEGMIDTEYNDGNYRVRVILPLH